ncbi:MAG: hypothetical protein FH749_13250 [Firmicutes bacterium]|nr:hypothetical protein [Bacillota bacterium]
MLILATGCSSKGNQDDNNTEPPPNQEEPVEPPPDDNGTIEREERNLYAVEDLEGIYTTFAIFGLRWDDDGRDSSFTLSTEGSDTYGEKLSLLIEEQ